MANAQLSSTTVEHGTPSYIIDAVRHTFNNRIDLDPATTRGFNKLIGAKRIYTKKDDALNEQWKAKNVFVNPPGGTRVMPGSGRKQSNMRLWWQKAVEEWESDRAKNIIFVAYSLELFQRGQLNVPYDAAPHMFPFCVPSARIPFDTWKHKRVSGKQPTHANAIILLSDVGTLKLGETAVRFEEAFRDIGAVRL